MLRIAYEDWHEELERIFFLMGYQEPVGDHEGWRSYYAEGKTPAQAIADDVAHAE